MRPGVASMQAISLVRVAPIGELWAGALLPCMSTTFRMEGASIVAMVLLDAGHPGSDPAGLPAVQPVAGHPGVVSGPAVEQGTKEVENDCSTGAGAWLVVSKGRIFSSVLFYLNTCERASLGSSDRSAGLMSGMSLPEITQRAGSLLSHAVCLAMWCDARLDDSGTHERYGD